MRLREILEKVALSPGRPKTMPSGHRAAGLWVGGAGSNDPGSLTPHVSHGAWGVLLSPSHLCVSRLTFSASYLIFLLLAPMAFTINTQDTRYPERTEGKTPQFPQC